MFGNNYPYYQPQMLPINAPYYPQIQNQQAPMMPQQPAQQPQAAQMPQDERIWVQGEGAAMAYLVAPGSFARLWDSTQPVFYEKQADASGRPLPMAVYDYTRRGGQPQQAQPDGERLKAMEERIKALEIAMKGGEQA